MRLIVIAIALLATLIATAGGGGSNDETVSISLQVVDATTGLPIIGADVHMDDQVYYTDPEGFVEITHDRFKSERVGISYISYLDAEIELASQAGLMRIALESR
ncbi:MAG: hypothetical protein HKN79_02970 [Flavobacteriales bacterium]|nr:hypothetical protein [Flavobacteriales bacterium]